MEIILDSTNTQTFQQAISQLTFANSGGTITIKRNVNIGIINIIPYNITLNFFTENILKIGDSTVNIYGTILSSTNYILDVNTNHNLKIHNQDILPEWFGVCSYQKQTNTISDDVQIQKAINAVYFGGVVLFKGKEYRIDNTINLSEDFVRLKGIKNKYAPAAGTTNNFLVVNSSLQNVFDIKAVGVTISDLNFTGFEGDSIFGEKGKNVVGTALSFKREPYDNPNDDPDIGPIPVKDIDCVVENCDFLSFKVCIYGEGTNLKIVDNHLLSSYIGIFINEPTLLVDGIISKVNPQNRGHVIDRNRFHSFGGYFNVNNLKGSTCIKIQSVQGTPTDAANSPSEYHVYGYHNQITNNHADDCKTFFEGSVDRTTINNNSILNSTETAIKAFAGVYGTISNNIIDGSHTWNPHAYYSFCEPEFDENNPIKCIQPNQPGGNSEKLFPLGHGIHVKFSNHLNINNNVINNKRFHGIYIERSRNTSINSNTISNFNRHAYIRPVNPSSGNNHEVETNDLKKYDGIHIACTEKSQGGDGKIRGYNIQNSIANNHISMPWNVKPENIPVGRYGIYMGDGDEWNFVKDNFILSARLIQTIKIESSTANCRNIKS